MLKAHWNITRFCGWTTSRPWWVGSPENQIIVPKWTVSALTRGNPNLSHGSLEFNLSNLNADRGKPACCGERLLG